MGKFLSIVSLIEARLAEIEKGSSRLFQFAYQCQGAREVFNTVTMKNIA